MFYAQFVLAKKGPLSKIWLAAHWEKKLTKSQIFETDVPQAIEEVMQPKVKMALRTVGHLLLGIVRIYSKKTRYLLADTNEAFLKMRLNFRNGFQFEIEDILEDEGENLDQYDEVNMTIPEFMDVELDERVLQANLSRLEDITLKDDRDLNSVFSNLKNIEIDNFGGQGIDDFGELEEIYCSYPSSSIHTPNPSVVERARLGSLAPQSFDETRGYIKPADQTNFVDSIYEEEPVAVRNGDLFNSMVEVIAQDGAPGEEFNDSHDDRMELGPDDIAPENEQNNADNRGSFALEPLNMSHIEGKKGRKAKRARNLIIDDNTTITDESAKKQMEDFSDILTTITMAPPSKKMLKMCVTGDLNHLMNEPGANIGNKELKKIYQSRLIPTAYKPDLSMVEEESSSSGKQSQPWDDLELNDNVADNISVQFGDNRPISRIDDFFHYDAPGDDHFPPIPEEADRTIELENASGVMPNIADEFGGFGFNTDGNKENKDEEEYSDPFSLSSNSSRGKLEAYGFGSAVKTAIYQDGKWAKRSKQIMKKISSDIEDGGMVTFSSIVDTAKTRKQAAEQFYTLLSLAKSQAITVDQSDPFGDIFIQAGEAFNDHVGNFDRSVANVSATTKNNTGSEHPRTPFRAI